MRVRIEISFRVGTEARNREYISGKYIRTRPEIKGRTARERVISVDALFPYLCTITTLFREHVEYVLYLKYLECTHTLKARVFHPD